MDKPELIISQYGLRKTTLRVTLLTFFINHQGPQKLAKVRAAVKRISGDRVTLYRELEKLTSLSILSKVGVEGVDCYELNERHHDHAVCNNCKKIICLPCTHKDKIVVKGWKNIVHQVIVKGLCKHCS